MSNTMLTYRGIDLRKNFDGVHALEGVDFNLPVEGIVAIIGPNGAGKTTLLNVLTGFIRPDSGQCFLGNAEVSKLPPHKIARLGIARTFQELRLIYLVPVIENVLLARPSQKGEQISRSVIRFGIAQEEIENRAVAMHWLRFIGLDGYANTLTSELSYGQQKLLTFACCLATEARILLLDEPVSGVHPEMIAKMLGLLRQVRDAGKLVVFIEHDIAAVREIADKVIVMDEGKIIAQGKPSEVLDRPEIIEAYIG